jgi:hypothetical protein
MDTETTFKAMVEAAGGQVAVAAKARVGVSTVYRAGIGKMPRRSSVAVLARALRASEADVVAAIRAAVQPK